MSSDPDKRLHFHNLGLNTSTRNGAPWEQAWVRTHTPPTAAPPPPPRRPPAAPPPEPMLKTEALRLEQKIKTRRRWFLTDRPR
ncbi:MAG: hypothetical protein IPL27_04490 [Lewinellaceae bacterium]|nr:hypothetical protein [Lewinellaceae bacterium]